MSLDRLIGALAERQEGVVGRKQLLGLGLTEDQIEGRVARGLLHPIHRGVYAVGHRTLSHRGRWHAALLAFDVPVWLAYRSAAALLALGTSPAGRPHVLIADGGRHARPGIRVHRTRLLLPEDTTVHEGFPTTTPARTILDLADVLPARRIERIIEEAEKHRHHVDLGGLVLRARGRRGAKALRQIAGLLTPGTTWTRSDVEEAFLAIVDSAGLPRPKLNQYVAGCEVDALWPEHRLVVELDTPLHHGTAAAFERDRARDARLTVAGYRVVRFTDLQLQHEPRTVAATLAALLARRAA